MAKYIFFNLPAISHVNPTLAIVEELVARGEEVVYYLPEHLRAPVEAAGATFRSYQFNLFTKEHTSSFSQSDYDNTNLYMRLAMMQMYLIRQSVSILPDLLESVRAEKPDCIVYDAMFLWAKFVAEILHIPAVGLRPSYDFSSKLRTPFANLTQISSPLSNIIAALNKDLIQLSDAYGLPFRDVRSIPMDVEGLILVFMPRAFVPDNETFDQRFLFVGPSLQPDRHRPNPFPLEILEVDPRPCFYIAFGSIFNQQADFYNLCLNAFADTEWRVVLSTGQEIGNQEMDPSLLQSIPSNFIVAPYVAQLELLQHTTIFLNHGGLNSVMESLYYGVPLLMLPQTLEHKEIAQRIQELELGIVLDEASLTPQRLRETVTHLAHDPTVRHNIQNMQQKIREAGGYRCAVDAIMHYIHTHA